MPLSPLPKVWLTIYSSFFSFLFPSLNLALKKLFKNQQVAFIDKLSILMHTKIANFLKWEWVLIDLSSCIFFEK
jgi:hypothetical protein